MITDFMENELFVVFTGSATSNTPTASRVLGPFHLVRFSAKGIWAVKNDGTEPTRLATQDNGLSWKLDGDADDSPTWGTVEVISPQRGTAGSQIMQGTDWIKPGKQAPPTMLYFADFNGNITEMEAKPYGKNNYTVATGKYAGVYNRNKANGIGAGSFFTSWKVAREAALSLLDGSIARMQQNIKTLKQKHAGETEGVKELDEQLERLKKKRQKLDEMDDPT